MAIGDIVNSNSYSYWQWDIGRTFTIPNEYASYKFLIQNEGDTTSYVSNPRKQVAGQIYTTIPAEYFQSGKVEVVDGVTISYRPDYTIKLSGTATCWNQIIVINNGWNVQTNVDLIQDGSYNGTANYYVGEYSTEEDYNDGYGYDTNYVLDENQSINSYFVYNLNIQWDSGTAFNNLILDVKFTSPDYKEYYEVPIPNIVLQKAGNAYAYYCDGIITENEETDEHGNKLISISNLKTIARQTLVIHQRGKPNDYVYTEEDLLSYMTYGDNLQRLTEQLDRVDEQLTTFMPHMEEKTDDLRDDLNAYQGGAETVYSHLEKRVSRIEQHIDQEYFITDDTIAYTKEVPINVCSYAQLNSIGGMTYKCDNLLKLVPPNNNPWTQDLAVCQFDNGIITVDSSGLMSKTVTFTFETEIELLAGEDYWVSSGQSNTSPTTWRMYIAPTVQGAFASKYTVTAQGVSLGPISANTGCKIYIQVYEGAQPKNIVFIPTISYASISSNGTPYFEGLRDSKVTAVTVHGANLFNQVALDGRSNAYSVDANGVTLLKLDGAANITVEPFATLDAGDYIIYSTLPDVCRFSLYNYNGELIKASSKGTMTFTLTMPTPVRVKILAASEVSYPVFVGNIACVSGTTTLPYKPYREPITYAIPEELQGTVKGINETYHDYTDIENKKSVISCRKYTFTGAETWVSHGATDKGLYRYSFNLTDKVNGNTDGLCNKYPTWNGDYNNNTEESVRFGQANTALYLYLASNLSVTEVAALTKGMEILYPLAEPIKTDIATEFDNLIEVEGGGSIEFVNEYEQAVPSSITYLLKGGNI